MIDWFRSWHGAPTDPKWRTIAKRAGATPSLVVAIAWALMDRASQADERGSIDGLDAETLADFMDCDPEAIDRVIQAMRDKCVLTNMRFSTWDKHQPKREREDSSSAERVRAHRGRVKESQSSAADADVTPCNANDENVTPCNTTTLQETPRVEENREEKKERTACSAQLAFEKFWEVWPNKVGKPAAEKAFAKHALKIDAILAGVQRYIRSKPADRPWLNPATFLNQERWNDAPALSGQLGLLAPPSDPSDPRINFPGGFTASQSDLVKAHSAGKWDVNRWGAPPGQPGCRVPERFLAAFTAISTQDRRAAA